VRRSAAGLLGAVGSVQRGGVRRANDVLRGASRKPAGTPCDDGDACTFDDECDGAGACVGARPGDPEHARSGRVLDRQLVDIPINAVPSNGYLGRHGDPLRPGSALPVSVQGGPGLPGTGRSSTLPGARHGSRRGLRDDGAEAGRRRSRWMTFLVIGARGRRARSTSWSDGERGGYHELPGRWDVRDLRELRRRQCLHGRRVRSRHAVVREHNDDTNTCDDGHSAP